MVKNHKNKFLTKTNLIFFSSGLFFLFLFFAFTLWVRADHLRSFDFDTTVRLQEHTPLRFDTFFSILSVVGRFEYTVTALVLVLLIWSKLKPGRIVRAVTVVGLFGAAHVFELIGKTLLEQPAPPTMFLRSQFSEFPGLYVHSNASYPSGHSLRIVFLATVYIYLIFKSKFPKAAKFLLYVFITGTAFSMLYSRITLGEHWTTDVIGGILLGLASSLVSLILL